MARTKAARWGNSLAIRLPKTVAESAAVREGDELQIEATGTGALRVVKARKRRELEKLVAAINSENCHTEMDWGRARGREVW
jgi:antitoxin MazE